MMILLLSVVSIILYTHPVSAAEANSSDWLATASTNIQQVYPFHEIGFSAATQRITIVGSVLRGASKVLLDGYACRVVDSVTAVCPIGSMATTTSILDEHTANSGTLLYQQASLLNVDGVDVLLNATYDASLIRRVALTPILEAVKVSSWLLNEMSVTVTWSHIETGEAVLAYGIVGGVQTCGVLSHPTIMNNSMSTLACRIPWQSSESGCMNISVVSVDPRQLGLRSLLRDDIWYHTLAPHYLYDTSAGGATALFVCMAVSFPVVDSVTVSAPLLAALRSWYFVTLRGSFPLGAGSPSVSLSGFNSSFSCSVVSFTSVTIQCVVPISARDDLCQLPTNESSGVNGTTHTLDSVCQNGNDSGFGVGYAELFSSANDTWTGYPPQPMQSGWNALGPVTRSIVAIPSSVYAVGIHCVASFGDMRVFVVDRIKDAVNASGNVSTTPIHTREVLIDVCSVSSQDSFSSNSSTQVVQVASLSTLDVIVMCGCNNSDLFACSSSSRTLTAANELCAVSLELYASEQPNTNACGADSPTPCGVNSSNVVNDSTGIPTANSYTNNVAVVEIRASSFSFDANVSVLLTSTLALQLPSTPVRSAEVCMSISLNDIIVSQGGASRDSIGARFSSNVSLAPGSSLVYGVWRNTTASCHWHVSLTMNGNCSSLLAMYASSAYYGELLRLVYCGPRHLMLDPIPWSSMSVPRQVVLSDIMEGGVFVPSVEFSYFPSAVVALSPHTVWNRSMATSSSLVNTSSGAGTGDRAVRVFTYSTTVSALGQVNLTGNTSLECTSSFVTAAALVPADADLVGNNYSASLSVLADAYWLNTDEWGQCINATTWNVSLSIGGTPAGVYRLLLFLATPSLSSIASSIAIPSLDVVWSATNSNSNNIALGFIKVLSVITSVSTDTISAQGGGLVTMRGVGFPFSGIAFSVIDNTTGSSPVVIEADLVVSSSTFLSWVIPDVTMIGGNRVLNTIVASTMLTFSFGGVGTDALLFQQVTGVVSILQPSALPTITSLRPLLFSPMDSPVFTIVGTALTMKVLSLCRALNQSRATPSPFYERDIANCELCRPMFINATYATCFIKYSTPRMGSYAFYVSSTPQGGVGFSSLVQFSLHFRSVTPTIVSPYGLGVLTIRGDLFVEGLRVILYGSIQQIECTVFFSNASLITCTIPRLDQTSLLQTIFEVQLRKDAVNTTIRCDDPTLCQIRFDGSLLPTIDSVVPVHGQYPFDITVYGLRFTGNDTLLEPLDANFGFSFGTTPCVVVPPVYFDRIICSLAGPCDTSSDAQLQAIVSPYGRFGAEFNAQAQFHCDMTLQALFPVNGSTMGGQTVTLYGTGFPALHAPIVQIAGIECNVTSFSLSTIVCITNSVGSMTDLVGTVVVASRTNEDVRSECCTYSYLVALTPTVTHLAPTSGSEGVRATIVGTLFRTGVNVEMSGIRISAAVVLSSSSINLLIPRLPPSVSQIRLSISGIGLAFHAPTLENFTYSLTVSRIAPLRGSYNSGLLLTIIGSGLGINVSTVTPGTVVSVLPVTQVLICGQLCPLSSLDFTSLTCQIPSYLDIRYLFQYPSHNTGVSLDARVLTAYRYVPGGRWLDVTATFTSNTSSSEKTIIATTQTEVFVIAANKHSRLALNGVIIVLDAVRNLSQNVSCRLQQGTSAIEGLNTFDGRVSDWSSAALWTATPTASIEGMLSGSNVNTFAYSAARYFLLTCERLVAGETALVAVALNGVVVGMANQGGVCPINIVVTSTSTVYESCSDPAAKQCYTFTYDTTLTPVVVAASLPYSLLSTATRISLTGSGFGLSTDVVTSVTVGGMGCQVQLAQESSLVCVTQGILSPVQASSPSSSTIFISGKGSGEIFFDEPFIGGELWSSPLSWYGETLPSRGSIVYIPEGSNIVLDHSPEYLTAIVVAGTLVIADLPLELRLCLLLVLASGTVQVGNAITPLTSLFTMTFVADSHLSQSSVTAYTVDNGEGGAVDGVRMHMAIVVVGGTFRVHGQHDATTSSPLQQTAASGARSIVVQDRVAWPIGASILITSTEPNLTLTEERTIISKTLIGTTSVLGLNRPLDYTHTRVTEAAFGTTLELTARVLFLTRNVVVRAEDHVMSRGEGVSMYFVRCSSVILDGVGIRSSGKTASPSLPAAAAIEVIGGVLSPSLPFMQYVVVNSSLHRGVNIQQAGQATLSNNVVYQTEGHGIAVWDGSWNITLTLNIVCQSHRTRSTTSDIAPSNFYLTTTKVQLNSNFAFGAEGDSVTFDFSADSVSLIPRPSCDSQSPIFSFALNTLCGAGGTGLRITPNHVARALPCVDVGLGSTSNPFLTTVVSKTLIFGCLQGGIRMGTVGSISFVQVFMIDNGGSAISLGASMGMVTLSDSVLSVTLIDGTSVVNTMTERSGLVIRGGAANAVISNVVIRNESPVISSVALSTCAAPQQSLYFPTFVSSSKLSITGSGSRVSGKFCGSVVFLDSDGSLTQLQREVYVVAQGMRDLNPVSFTMCRTPNNTDMPATVQSQLMDETNTSSQLLVCETSSTYSIFAMTITLMDCPQCVNVDVRVLHDGVEMRRYRVPLTEEVETDLVIATSRITLLVVDGRPSTTTPLTSIFSPKLQYYISPECIVEDIGIACEPQGGYGISRYGVSRPTYPFTTYVPGVVNMTFLSAVSVVPAVFVRTDGAYQLRVASSSGTPLQAAQSNTEVQQVFVTLQQQQQVLTGGNNNSLWIANVFSVVTTTEFAWITADTCREWCVTPVFPAYSSYSDSATVVNWTDSRAWTGGSIPMDDQTVSIIPQGVTVILNKNVSFMQALVVYGTLVLDSDALGRPLHLSCTQLVVFGVLRIQAAAQNTGGVRITLLTMEDLTALNRTSQYVCALNASAEIQVEPNMRVACGTILVVGSINATGMTHETWWSASQGIPSGSQGISASTRSPLKANSLIGLTSGDSAIPVGEVNTLSKDIPAGVGFVHDAVAQPWRWNHGATPVSKDAVRYVDVVTLDNSITIACGRSSLLTGYSCRWIIQDVSYPSQALPNPTMLTCRYVSVVRFGTVTSSSLDPVILMGGIRVGAPALSLINGTASLVGVVIFNSTHTGLYVDEQMVNVTLSNIVVWGSHGSGIILETRIGASLDHCLVVGSLFPTQRELTVIESVGPSFSGDSIVCNILDVGGASTMVGTTVAGGEGYGFCLSVTACQSTPAQWPLIAYGCQVGVFLFSPVIASPVSTCIGDVPAFSGFEVYSNTLVGFFSTQHDSMSISNLLSANNPIGLYASSRGSGVTRISSSSFLGTHGTTVEACQTQLPCSWQGSASATRFMNCFETIFNYQMINTGIMIVPSSMADVSITYAIKPNTSNSELPPVAVLNDHAYLTTMTSTVSISGVTFQSFSAICGAGISFHPLALSTTYPSLSTSNIRTDDADSLLFAPASTMPMTWLLRSTGECGGDACNPRQSILINDVDGSIRGANATSVILGRQAATELMSCDPRSYTFAVCATTISTGRLILFDLDDNQNFTFGCVNALSQDASFQPLFSSCTAAQRGPGIYDPFVAMVVETGVTVEVTTTSHVPRHVSFALEKCRSNLVVKLQLEEIDMRLTVWANGMERSMASQLPTTSSRNGEWYRNPKIIGDDSVGGLADWVAIAVGCDAMVELHAIVYGRFDLIVNVSTDVITYGLRYRLAQSIASLLRRDASTVFVASVEASWPNSQSVVRVRIEGTDGLSYNATKEALRINAELDVLQRQSVDDLTSALGIVVFSTSVTFAKLFIAPVEPPASLFTLKNVLTFSGAIAGLIGLGGLFYWYLLALRITSAAAHKKEYSGLIFTYPVEQLPDTDTTVDVEETVPETSLASRTRAYVAEWAIVSTRQAFTDAAFGSSMHSSESATSDRPPSVRVPPLASRMLDVGRVQEGGGTPSVVNAFLNMNIDEFRRSPRPSSISFTPAGAPLMDSSTTQTPFLFVLDPAEGRRPSGGGAAAAMQTTAASLPVTGDFYHKVVSPSQPATTPKGGSRFRKGSPKDVPQEQQQSVAAEEQHEIPHIIEPVHASQDQRKTPRRVSFSMSSSGLAPLSLDSNEKGSTTTPSSEHTISTRTAPPAPVSPEHSHFRFVDEKESRSPSTTEERIALPSALE